MQTLLRNKLYNMDFREGLGKIDGDFTIVTDPPYNIDFKYNEYNDKLHDDEYVKLISNFKNHPLAIIHYPEDAMRYFVPALGVPNEVITWCYNSNLPKQSRLINFYNCKVDYTKVLQPYKNPTDKRVKALIAKGRKGTRSYDWFSDIQMVKNVSKTEWNHPCPVPVKLMERIILLTTNKGDLVVDPFMGSGTTAIAAMNTGRDFIGFELSSEYYQMSLKRLSQHFERV